MDDDDDDEMIDVDDLAEAVATVNGAGLLHHYLRQDYSTAFKLQLIDATTPEALARKYGMTVFAAMCYCDVAVVRKLMSRAPFMDFIYVVLDVRVRDENVLACMQADATGDVAHWIVNSSTTWHNIPESFAYALERAPARPVAACAATFRMMLRGAYADYVVLPYARHLRRHPDRSKEDLRTDRDLRVDGTLPTAWCSDRRRDALVEMGFTAETTSLRLLREARLRASMVVLAGLADPVEGVHRSRSVARITAKTGGDGDKALRRIVRDRLADLTHRAMVAEWTVRNGVERISAYGGRLPAMRADDPDNVNNVERVNMFVPGDTLHEQFASRAALETRAFGELAW